MALVLAPTDPLDAWFSDLDEVARRSPGFFGGRAIIVDLSAIKLSKAELKKLMASLHEREIRVMGIEGADPSMLDLGMPPSVNGGRPAGAVEVPNAASQRRLCRRLSRRQRHCSSRRRSAPANPSSMPTAM